MNKTSRNGLLAASLALVALAALGGCASSGKPKHPVAAKPPPPPPPPPTTQQLLVQSMHQSIVLAGEPDHVALISLAGLHNQSHAGAEEFQAMRAHLAALLGRAAVEKHVPVDFTLDPADDVDFQLVGTVYLVTVTGFDCWEMFLDLRQATGTTTVWRPPGPVRLLRQPREGAPEMQLIQQRR